MSTTRKAHLSTGRRARKTLEQGRVVSGKANKRPQRQKTFRYHHYA